jgi:MFS family permease
MRIGTFIGAIAPAGILIPGLGPLLVVRLAQGTTWAVTSVTQHALMAKLAPSDRRGEASGYFIAMPALAALIAPALGVALYASTGAVGPVILAGALAFAAFLIALRIRVPGERAHEEHEPPPDVRSGPIVERSAMPATVMVTTFMSAQALFVVFPPVYAVHVGADLESLVLYYPAYGLVMVLSQVLAGRLSDRLGRGPTIRIGCAFAVAGLAIAALGLGMLGLAVGAGAYAIAVSIVSPTLSAVTMDRAPQDRLGSAMATYSVGYMLATGASSLAWGAIVATMGFGAAFLVGIGLQALTVGISLRSLRPTPA